MVVVVVVLYYCIALLTVDCVHVHFAVRCFLFVHLNSQFGMEIRIHQDFLLIDIWMACWSTSNAGM